MPLAVINGSVNEMCGVKHIELAAKAGNGQCVYNLIEWYGIGGERQLTAMDREEPEIALLQSKRKKTRAYCKRNMRPD